MREYKKIFIVGSGRSGTHWLNKILKSHRHVVSNDYESSIFKVILGSFTKARLPWNKSWKTVWKNFENSHLNEWVSEKRLKKLIRNEKKHNSKNLIKAKNIVKIILDEYFEKHAEGSNCVLVEKTPGHIYYIREILDLFPEALIVEIIRDGRDVCKSLDQLANSGVSWAPNKLNEQMKLWKNALKPVRDLRKNPLYSSKILTVKFEALLNEKLNTLEGIFKFCGLEFDNELAFLIEEDSLTATKNPFQSWDEYFDETSKIKMTENLDSDLKQLGYL